MSGSGFGGRIMVNDLKNYISRDKPMTKNEEEIFNILLIKKFTEDLIAFSASLTFPILTNLIALFTDFFEYFY